MPPLAEKLRPKHLSEVVGQSHLLGENGWIKRSIDNKNPSSFLLFGPPGSGKTTIARLYAQALNCNFKALSAIFSGIADIKKIVSDIKEMPLLNKQTLLFIDEIHRFNKAQQDAFLPLVEDGTIILIGATTENPSFCLNNALLSRMTVLTLNPLSFEDLETILKNYESKIKSLPLKEKERKYLIELSSGDGRYLLNMVESIENYNKELDINTLQKLLQKKASLYDKHGEYHFNLISALHKSVRSSDPDASLYWLSRMLAGGEDPLYIARRLIRMASEDIGLADPQAIQLALSAYQTYQMLGSPEGEIALAQITIYLALSPKSNSVYMALNEALEEAKKTSHIPPPLHILNAPTDLMKSLGYGKDYVYDHDTKDSFSGQECFPQEMKRSSYYKPHERGFEREMKKRLEYFSKLKEALKKNGNS
jgi:putative ATPase